MPAIRHTFLIAIALLLLCGCWPSDESAENSKPTTAKATAAPSAAASASNLDALIASQGSVTFRSFGGKWIGTDGDTDLTFLPNGAFHMFEYGFAVTGYPGTYKIDSTGHVTVQLPTFGQAWPAMLLQRDGMSLLLVPAQKGNDFVMGNRGGATFVKGQGTYWPFRPLNATEEGQVRERIGNGS